MIYSKNREKYLQLKESLPEQGKYAWHLIDNALLQAHRRRQQLPVQSLYFKQYQEQYYKL
jgi:hypothetical protein